MQRHRLPPNLSIQKTKRYDKMWLDRLCYLDFSIWETQTGVLLHYAKQGQNKFLTGIMLNEIRERIYSFDYRYKKQNNFITNLIAGLIAYTFFDKKPAIKYHPHLFQQLAAF